MYYTKTFKVSDTEDNILKYFFRCKYGLIYYVNHLRGVLVQCIILRPLKCQTQKTTF